MNILILEDTPARVEWLKQNYPDHSISSRGSVKEFIELYEQQDWDLIILDRDLTLDLLLYGENSAQAFSEDDYTWQENIDYTTDRDGLTGNDACIRITPKESNPPVLIWSQACKELRLLMRDELISKGFRVFIREFCMDLSFKLFMNTLIKQTGSSYSKVAKWQGTGLLNRLCAGSNPALGASKLFLRQYTLRLLPA